MMRKLLMKELKNKKNELEKAKKDQIDKHMKIEEA